MQVAALFSTLCAACPDQSHHIPENHLLCRVGAHAGQCDQHYSWKFINFQQAETTWEAWLFFTVEGRQPIHGVLFVFPDDISVINCSHTCHFTHFITLTSLCNTSGQVELLNGAVWAQKLLRMNCHLQIYVKGSSVVAKQKTVVSIMIVSDIESCTKQEYYCARCMKVCKTIGYVMFF